MTRAKNLSIDHRVSQVSEKRGFRRCQFKDEADDCSFFFAYHYDKENKVYIKVQEKKACPQEIDLLAIILGKCDSENCM